MSELSTEVLEQQAKLFKLVSTLADKDKKAEMWEKLSNVRTTEDLDTLRAIINKYIVGVSKPSKGTRLFKTYPELEKALDEEMAKIDGLVALYHKQNKTSFLAKERHRLCNDLDAIVYTFEKDVKAYLIRNGMRKVLMFAPDGNPKGESSEIIDVFLHWSERPETDQKQLFGMTYYPKMTDVIDGKWNTFYDTSVEPIKGDKHQMFLEFVLEVICNRNREYYDFVIKWLAHLVQKPWQKPQTALSIASKVQGIGKSTFVDVLALMIGHRNSVTALSEKDVEGSFNYIMAEKLLINFDEATFAGDHRQAGFMKKLVTQSKGRVERKFGDAKEVEDYSRVIITTNNVINGTPAGISDRRWVLLEPSDSWKKNGKLHTLINLMGVQHSEDKMLDYEKSDKSAIQNLKWYLQEEVDITEFKPWNVPAQTSGLATRLAMAWREEPYHAFFIEWCASGHSHIDTKDEEKAKAGENIQIGFDSRIPALHLWNALATTCDDIPGVQIQKKAFYNQCDELGFRYHTGTGNVKFITLPSREKVWQAVWEGKTGMSFELPPLRAEREGWDEGDDDGKVVTLKGKAAKQASDLLTKLSKV